MGRKSRVKGSTYELEIAKILSAALHLQIERRLTQSRDGGDDLTGLPRFAVECKRRAKSPSVLTHLRQAQRVVEDDASGRFPVVIMRGDNAPNTVTMFVPDWLELVKVYLKEQS